MTLRTSKGVFLQIEGGVRRQRGRPEEEDHVQRAGGERRGLDDLAAQVLPREPHRSAHPRGRGGRRRHLPESGGDGPVCQVELPVEHSAQPEPGAALRLGGGMRQGKGPYASRINPL